MSDPGGPELEPPAADTKVHWWKKRADAPAWMIYPGAALLGICAPGLVIVSLIASGLSGDLDDARADTAREYDRAEIYKRNVADATEERNQAVQDQLTAEAAARTAEREKNLAETAARQAEQDRDEVLARFDAEIQAAIAKVQADADRTVCSAGDTAGFVGLDQPTLTSVLEPILATIPAADALDLDPGSLLNTTVLQSSLDRCFQQGALRRTLDGPHGDGLFTVGLEISAGKWRSDGTGDSCYWKISPDGDPDKILSNHFGNAGGTVTLKAGQEFESDRCGNWTKVG